MTAVDLEEEVQTPPLEPQPGEPQPGEPPPPEEPPEEPPEPPPPPGPMTEQEMEKALKQLDREAVRHRDAISRIMGEDAQVLIPCELCEPHIAGFRWPEEVPYDRQQLVLAAIGVAGTESLAVDDEAEQCDRCHGHGETLTGSLVLNQRTRPCEKCGANGWTSRQQRDEYAARMRAVGAAAELAQPQPPAAGMPADGRPLEDPWTRPKWHPNYGKHPLTLTEAERATDWPGAA